MPAWIVAPSGCARRRGGDAPIDVRRHRRRHLDEGPVDLGPAGDLADVDLVAPERARHPGVDLEEERHRADERRDVVAVGAQREVPVPVHRGRRRQHQRALRRLPQQARHLAEVVGDELAAALVERRSGDRGQEVRHVQQVVAELAVQVGPVVQRVHLVHPHAVEALGVGLDGVEHRHGLAVGERHDQVVAVVDVVEDVARTSDHGLPPAHDRGLGDPHSGRSPARRCRCTGPAVAGTTSVGRRARSATVLATLPSSSSAGRAWQRVPHHDEVRVHVVRHLQQRRCGLAGAHDHLDADTPRPGRPAPRPRERPWPHSTPTPRPRW